MEDFTPPKDNLEDAQIKFQRLCEMANDIEVNGPQGSDAIAHQIVLSAVLKSDNEFLHDILEQALFDENHTELLKTMLAGILGNKKKIKPLLRLIDETLNDDLSFDETTAKKDSLLLVSDAIIRAICEKTHDHSQCICALYKIYVASCLEKNDYPLADKLLQQFINTLPGKAEAIDAMLLNIIKDKNMEINPKLVAIEILTRSKGGDVFECLEDIMLNINDYANDAKEMLYLLDVITKAINAMMVQGVGLRYDEVLSVLNNLQFLPGIESHDLLAIINRIESRIKDINEMHDRVN
ncbi:MAG: hypothetical protein PHE78_01440 [Candidatus Gastranaerophilales bacterium]|nr:hypothetical protein [Candidatus Gastranaerophilales bacterium]